MSDLGSIVGSDSSDSASQMEGVEKIEAQAGRRYVILALQSIAIVAFIGAMVGGFIYAIHYGEKNKKEEIEVTEPPLVDNSTFSVLINQYCEIGKYVVTLKLPNNSQTFIEYDSFWYQDNTRSLIKHKYDDHTIVYAFSGAIYWVTVDNGNVTNCTPETFSDKNGYAVYLERLGLFDMEARHSEIRLIKGGHETYVYDGDPDAVQNPFIQDMPFFVQGYVNVNNCKHKKSV